MSEIIQLNIGGAGVNIAFSVWENLRNQYKINLEGQLQQTDKQKQKDNFSSQSIDKFFHECSENIYSPRNLLIDTDIQYLQQIESSQYKNFFSNNYSIQPLIYNANSSSYHNRRYSQNSCYDLYTEGYLVIGKEYIDYYLDLIRKQVEKCSNFQGFYLFRSLQGGTGSGLGDLLLERLDIEFKKKKKISFDIHPSLNQENNVVSILNSVFTYNSIHTYDLSFCLQNEQLFSLLGEEFYDENDLTMINKIIADYFILLNQQIIIDDPAYNNSMSEIVNNLSIYPRTKFIQASCPPYVQNQSFNDRSCLDQNNQIEQSLKGQNLFTQTNINKGKYIAANIQINGDLSINSLFKQIEAMKNQKKINFVEGVQTGFKVGYNEHLMEIQKVKQVKEGICTAINHTSITDIFEQEAKKFDKLYYRRAFIHWYVGCGLDSGFINEQREQIASLIKDYECFSDPYDIDDSDQE